MSVPGYVLIVLCLFMVTCTQKIKKIWYNKTGCGLFRFCIKLSDSALFTEAKYHEHLHAIQIFPFR